MCWKRCNCATTLDHLLLLYNNRYLTLPCPSCLWEQAHMWQGKDSKRTFLLQAHFIYLHPPPHSRRCTFSPSLPRFQAFLFGDHGEGFFFSEGRECCRGNSSRLTLLWEESRFFWHQWVGGRDGGWCGVGRGIDRRRLLWMVAFCSTLQHTHVLQQAYTCSRSRLDSHIYHIWERRLRVRPHAQSRHKLLSALSRKVKMCGNYVRVASGSCW